MRILPLFMATSHTLLTVPFFSSKLCLRMLSEQVIGPSILQSKTTLSHDWCRLYIALPYSVSFPNSYSDGLHASSDGLHPSSADLHPSDGLHPSSDDLHPGSDGLRPSSDGLQPIVAMATTLEAMASTLVAMASTLVAMAMEP